MHLFSRRQPTGSAGGFTEADEANARRLPPVTRNPALWCCSCRDISSGMSTFPPELGAAEALLFQPDTRLFCPHVECRDHSAEHRRLYIHADRGTILAAAAACAPTRVVNRPAVLMTLPHVAECWLVHEGSGVTEMQLPMSLESREVFIWVHGLGQRYFRVVGVASHLANRLGCDPDAADEGRRVVAFLWPSHTRRRLAYAPARSNAMRAAPRLRALLCALRQAGCAVTLAAHGMGARVALRALLSPSGRRNEPPLCEHLVLLSAAVDCAALNAHGEFPRERLQCVRVTNLYSASDPLLQRERFYLGEALSAAGGLAGGLAGGGGRGSVAGGGGGGGAAAGGGGGALASGMTGGLAGGGALGCVGAARDEAAGERDGASARAREHGLILSSATLACEANLDVSDCVCGHSAHRWVAAPPVIDAMLSPTHNHNFHLQQQQQPGSQPPGPFGGRASGGGGGVGLGSDCLLEFADSSDDDDEGDADGERGSSQRQPPNKPTWLSLADVTGELKAKLFDR